MDEYKMRDYQIILYKLLCEIDKLCLENDIRYSLIKGTIIEACQNKLAINSPYAYITMRISDCVKFAELVHQKKMKNRAIESWLSNPRFYGMHMRYCDTGTLLYPVRNVEHMQYPCLGVEIIPLASFPEKKFYQKVFRVIKEGSCVGKNSWFNTTPRRIVAYYIMKILNTIVGKRRMAKFAFFLEGKSERIFYYQFFENSMPKFISRVAWLGDLNEITIEEKKFPALANIVKKWGHVKINNGNSIQNYVMDTEHSYIEYLEVLKDREHKRNLNEYRKTAKKQNVDLSIKYFRSLLFVRKSRTLLDRAEERIKIEKEYKELKPLVISLFAQEKNEDLIKVLTPYISKAKKYYGKRLPFCIEPELHYISIIALHRTGQMGIAKQFEDNLKSSINYYRKVQKKEKTLERERLELLELVDEEEPESKLHSEETNI